MDNVENDNLSDDQRRFAHHREMFALKRREDMRRKMEKSLGIPISSNAKLDP